MSNFLDKYVYELAFNRCITVPRVPVHPGDGGHSQLTDVRRSRKVVTDQRGDAKRHAAVCDATGQLLDRIYSC